MLGLFSDPTLAVIWIAALLSAITIHEFAHAFAADRLGDPTPRSQGRLTLNPLAHLDLLGTAALFLVGFGWGKPVQFDPFNLRNPRRDAAIISFAGPVSNILLAIVLSLLATFLSSFSGFVPFIAMFFIDLNVRLAVFNLIPVHPLDGGKVLVGLLPENQAHVWDRILHQYGLFILLGLLLPLAGGLPLIVKVIGPTIQFIENLLLPQTGIGFI